MKGEKIFKQVASIITIVLLLQYVNILAPLMQVRAESATVDGIAWTYNIDSNGNAINVKPSNKNLIVGDITIPSELDGHSVVSIRNSAFSYCRDLTSINVPEGVTSIGNYAFYTCDSLTSINIPGGVTSIEDSTFSGCSRLANIEIPSSVTSIGNSAFSSCISLTSINIPEGVTSIGEGAFSGCRSLTSIEISSSVISIGNYAFNGCRSLTSINVEENNQSYCSEDAILFNKDKTELIRYPSKKVDKQYVIPNSVTSIGNYAFEDCSNLTSIDIPSSVTSIGNSAFAGCSSLTSIEIPEGVTSIGEYAFYNCRSLTSIEIPNSVTSIGEKAFNECKNLLFICEKDSYAYEYAKENNINVDTSDQTIVKFNDENLYSKIKEICNDLGKMKDYNDEKREITVNIIKEIKSLDLSNSQISDLTGIEKF